MFISSYEKAFLNRKIATLTEELEGVRKELFILHQSVSALMKIKTKGKKPMTAAQKEKQREYQRAYNARQKAKKLAEQGNINVSA